MRIRKITPVAVLALLAVSAASGCGSGGKADKRVDPDAHLLGVQPGHEPGQRQAGPPAGAGQVHPADRHQGQPAGDRLARPAQPDPGRHDVRPGAGRAQHRQHLVGVAAGHRRAAAVRRRDAGHQSAARAASCGPSLAATGATGKAPAGVPLYGQAYGLYYNKKMFAAAGIDHPPATWTELVADGKKLTKDGQWGLSLQAGQVTENAHHAAILGAQQGAQLFDASGKPHLSSPQEVAAIKQYVDLMATDKIVNPSDAEYTDTSTSLKDVATGKAAMFMNQASEGSFKLVGMNPDDLGVAPIPFPDPVPAGRAAREQLRRRDQPLGVQEHQEQGRRAEVRQVHDQRRRAESPQQDLRLAARRQRRLLRPGVPGTPRPRCSSRCWPPAPSPLPEVPQESQFETLVGGAMKTMFADAANGKPITDEYVKAKLDQADQQLAAGG